MGRAIDQDNRLDNLDRRLKLVEDALEELVQTRVHHVDLVEDVKESPVGAGFAHKDTKAKKKRGKKETVSA
jgi:hypothetical protein